MEKDQDELLEKTGGEFAGQYEHKGMKTMELKPTQLLCQREYLEYLE